MYSILTKSSISVFFLLLKNVKTDFLRKRNVNYRITWVLFIRSHSFCFSSFLLLKTFLPLRSSSLGNRMTEVDVQFSVKTSSARHRTKERNSSNPSTNLFHQHHPRNPLSSSSPSSILPIISLPKFTDLHEKFSPMFTSTKTIPPSSVEYRLKMPFNDRSRSIHTPRSPLYARPPTSSSYRLNSSQQRNNDLSPRRTPSARTPPIHSNAPLHQQTHLLTNPSFPRIHPQYNHFLAYLRRQSLARLRRRQEQDDGTVETTVTFHTPKPPTPSPRTFHSPSHLYTSETTSMPMIASSLRRNIRPVSSNRILPRTPSILKKIPEDENKVTSASFLITPANSIVEEITITPMKTAPYELQLTGDMLNYSYVSDSGMKYRGQLLSTAV